MQDVSKIPASMTGRDFRYAVNCAQTVVTPSTGGPRRDGVVEEMALPPDGPMAGYVVDCTERYSVAGCRCSTLRSAPAAALVAPIISARFTGTVRIPIP